MRYRIITFISALLILAFYNSALNSQVVVEKSKDKIVISGIPYYVHIVKKGETSYSISKAYNITVEELTKENPPALYGLKEGQSLRIPVRSETPAQPVPQVPVAQKRDETKFIYHKLNPGETIYFLSKSYGVSENEIVTSNKGIDINKLPVGAEIAIPRREFMTEKQTFEARSDKYLYHKVVKGETMSSIADKYGVTVRELRRENRDTRFPQVGDYIKVPGVKASETVIAEPVKAEEPAVALVTAPVAVRKSGYTEVKGLKGSFNVAVLLPFYIWENSRRSETDNSDQSKGKKKVVFRSEDWIYPRSVDFVEMYQGILLAADTLRSLGMQININAYDIRSDTVELTRLINSGKLAGMDLIIGPVYSSNLVKIASYARNLNIPVVSPVPLYSNEALANHPNLFLSNSSLTLGIAQNKLAGKLSEYYDNNFVLIHSDTTGTGEELKRFKNLLLTELSYRMPYEDIKFKELLFYSRSKFGNDSINRLSHSLSDRNKNVVIIASEESPVISEIIEDLHSLSRKFDIKVFGYPVIREIDNIDPKYLFDLDVMVYYPFWIDYSKPNVKSFISDYRSKFLTEPTAKSYAWNGYDIGFYFLSGLALNGKAFIEHPEIHNPELLQNEFDFMRAGESSGFENQKLFLIRYSKDYEVIKINENEPVKQK
jgi:LysM repeat protein